MNNTIPPDVQGFIESEARKDCTYKIKGATEWEQFDSRDYRKWIDGATSLYQHLQENGRVAELEKEVYSLNQKIYEGISENGSLKQEIERLKGLVNDSFQMAMDFSYKEGLSHGHYKKAETLFNNFKTKHNL